MVNKLYDLAVMQQEVPSAVRAHYENLSSNASDCISCAACEKRCPFTVSIVERMKKAEALFA
jgi:predicted aldo/keto reductase-like oxidoreductase